MMLTIPVFEKHEQVYNFHRSKAGKVKATPRADNPMVYVLLDGNITPCYYRKQEFYPPEQEGFKPTPDVPEVQDIRTVQEPPTTPIDVPAPAAPVPLARRLHVKTDGDKIKSYLITYITKTCEFKIEKVAAKGIVTAITMFYMQRGETSIVSVQCVL
jgi:hypothetical protein